MWHSEDNLGYQSSGATRLIVDAESFIGLEFANLAGLADRPARDPPIFCSPALGLQAWNTARGFLHVGSGIQIQVPMPSQEAP